MIVLNPRHKRRGHKMTETRLTLEITPPAKPTTEVLLRRARAMGGLPRAINVISRQDRWGSLEASEVLRRHGLNPVWHLANRGRSRSQIETEITFARAAGIDRVLCLRGEYKAADTAETPKICELVAILGDQLPRIDISITLNHHAEPSAVLRNLWPKLSSGATGIQTQVCFDLDRLIPVASEIKQRFPETRIAPMILPVLSRQSAIRIARRLSISFPETILGNLDCGGEAAGWRHFASLVHEIDRSSLFDGIALMTPIDVSPEFAQKVAFALGDAGIRGRALAGAAPTPRAETPPKRPLAALSRPPDSRVHQAAGSEPQRLISRLQ
jgi:5,10-methylenetetrahydrofolate reductase